MNLRDRVVKRLKRDLIEKPKTVSGWVDAVLDGAIMEVACWRDEQSTSSDSPSSS